MLSREGRNKEKIRRKKKRRKKIRGKKTFLYIIS